MTSKNGLSLNWTDIAPNNLSPPYRVFQCHSFGNFFGGPGQAMKNAPIPLTLIPKEVRDTLTKVRFGQGVAALEEMVKRANKDTLQNRWPADANRMFGASIYPGLMLMEAWNAIPVSFIVGILDTVRNRILNFALEIEQENPDAGDVLPTETPMKSSKVQQIFHTTINGNPSHMTIGSQHFSQSALIEVRPGNFEELSNLLFDVGFDDSDLEELREAIKADGKPKKSNLGGRVTQWVGKAVGKAAQGMLKVGTDMASKAIMEALFKYYGLPTS